MPYAPRDLSEDQLVRQLVDAIASIPGARAEVSKKEARSERDVGCDARIEAYFAGQPVTMFVEAKKTVYPRDVHQALWRLKLLTRGDEGAVALLAAASLSPGAKELLRAEGVGYFDSGGSLYVPAEGTYIFIEKPAPRVETAVSRSLFTGRRTQVIHALLVQHERWFGVKELAELSQVSPATASETLTELEKYEWIDVRGQGPSKERHPREPRALLDAWAAQVVAAKPPALRRCFVPGLKGDALLRRVAETFESRNVGYAVSHEAAAQRYTPYLSSVAQVRSRLLVGSQADEALAELEARVVNEGANFVIIEVKTPGELLFRERVDDVWLASPIHVYLDLLKSEGRAKEMAEHLRKERIGF